jgi:hypothetical protein
MNNSEQTSVDTKTCPACGGTWPSDRRNCLACEANLEPVPARPASAGHDQEPFDWAWLDAMAEERAAPGMPQPTDDEQRPGCSQRIFRA